MNRLGGNAHGDQVTRESWGENVGRFDSRGGRKFIAPALDRANCRIRLPLIHSAVLGNVAPPDRETIGLPAQNHHR